VKFMLIGKDLIGGCAWKELKSSIAFYAQIVFLNALANNAM
jgi:hypothetical protein